VATRPALQLNVPGYSHVRVGTVRLIALKECVSVLAGLLSRGTVYEQAAVLPDVHRLEGRAPVYVVTLAGCGEVAVRHSMRGGLVAKLTRDRFILPTGGFRELVNSVRLRQAGIRTPQVIAFVNYSAGFGTRRADIITRYVPGKDLAAIFKENPDEVTRRAVWDATAELVAALSAIGAHHQDLNLKNILISHESDRTEAWVLDVDRVRINPPSPIVLKANLGRLIHSLEKWRTVHALPVSAQELGYLGNRARGLEA
jgi:hypothetical protein